MRAPKLMPALLLVCLLGAVLLSAWPAPGPALAAGGHWGAAEAIEDARPDVSSLPWIVADDNGCAMAVWSYYVQPNSYVRAKRYAPGAGWGEEKFLASASDAGAPCEPRAAAAPNGNVVVVWQQTDGASVRVYASRYVAGTGWDSATRSLGTTADSGEPGYAQAAIDGAGRAVAVWAANGRISARVCSSAGAWGEAANLEDGSAGPASQAQVAMDSSGRALAVWSQGETGARHIYSSRYTDTGWSSAMMISTGAGTAAAPRLAMHAASGRAVAVWEQAGTAVTAVGASLFDGTGWDGPHEIDSGAAAAPHAAIDSDGNAVAVWQQSDGAVTSIRASRCSGTAWDNATTIEGGEGLATGPRVAVDSSGNAVAVWQQFDGAATSVWANRYAAGAGWGAAAAIENSPATAGGANVASGPDGNAVATWWQSQAGTETVWTNRYTADPGTSPAVHSVQPSQGAIGHSLEVLVRGANLAQASSVSFGPGVTVLEFVADNATRIRASISVASDAALGQRDVEVATPGGTDTLGGAFRVLAAPAVAAEQPVVPRGSLVPTFSGSVTDPEATITAIQYRVDGGDWQTVALERDSESPSLGRFTFATLLPPGDHTVEIRGASSAGDAVSEVATLSVTVGRRGTPVWVYVLAGAGVAAVAAAGGGLFWRRRRRALPAEAGKTRGAA